jgi:hypothetical protein
MVKRSHLFISHASEDRLFAELLVSKIREHKTIRPWIDTEHIVTGVNMLAALREGLSSMDIFVGLISQASIRSSWVKEEVECALRKQIEGESLLMIPFIIDSTDLKEVEALHPLLLNRRVGRTTADPDGASVVIQAIHMATGLPEEKTSSGRASAFQRDPAIEQLVRRVSLGNWDSALGPAFAVLGATDEGGNNELFRRLAKYQECPDEDLASGARMTMETLVDLAPDLFDRRLLVSMSRSLDFSVRASAASICLVLAQFAPDRVPLDVAMKLARNDEDWYVTEPATAALKSICKARRNVLYFFFTNLQHTEPQARAHAARALRGIAAKEPEILDPEHLLRALNELRRIGDNESERYIAEAYQKVRATEQEGGYKYGLGG